jgi:hypothetical protein
MQSIIIALKDPVQACILNRTLPNSAIKFGGIETLNPVSFPGWPSFADLLCDTDSKIIVGLTFHIPNNYLSIAKAFAESVSPEIIKLKNFGENISEDAYKDHPHSSWLEVVFSSATPNQLIDIQSSDVIWYKNPYTGFPVALGIEHLDNLISQVDCNLNILTPSAFPLLKLNFMND